MALPLIATGLFSFLGSLLSKFLTDSLLKFVAYKALAITLMITTLPILLKNFVVWVAQELNTVIQTVLAGSDLQAVTLEMSGLAAWLADCLMFVDCFGVLLTALSIRFVLNLIPFVG